MDAGTPATDPVLELALRHAREQRDEITLWLAAQVLMTDAWRWPTTRSRTG